METAEGPMHPIVTDSGQPCLAIAHVNVLRSKHRPMPSIISGFLWILDCKAEPDNAMDSRTQADT